MKKLLIITQKVDKNDPILGFFHRWILEFSKNLAKVTVICLEKGEYDLPENVEVLSLGKEEGKSKLKYIFRFFKYVFNDDYDAVFVHMNQEYVLLGSWFWKLKSKRVALWYNHTFGNLFTKIAMNFSDIVFHTSPYAFTANSKKSKRMPAGIDTDIFKQIDKVDKIKNSILYIGRIDEVKNVKLLIDAIEILKHKYPSIVVNIYGKASAGSEWYEDSLKLKVKNLKLENNVTFHKPVPNTNTPEIYSMHEITVNMTPKGNYDKTVLEAMACGSLPVVSSVAFKDFLPKEFIFRENNVKDFAEKLECVLDLKEGDTSVVSDNLRKYVKGNEGLDILLDRLILYMQKKEDTGTKWDKFEKEKLDYIFKNSKEVVDIGGSLKFLKDRGNRYSSKYMWLLKYLPDVSYKILDPVDTFNPHIIGDIHDLPFDDGSVSSIVCMSVLEHVENPIRACEEIRRSLKKGGMLYVYVPFLFYYHAEKDYYRDYWRFTEDSLRLLFRDFSSLEIVAVKGAIETWIKISPLGNIRLFINFSRWADKMTGKCKSKQVSGYNVFCIK